MMLNGVFIRRPYRIEFAELLISSIFVSAQPCTVPMAAPRPIQSLRLPLWQPKRWPLLQPELQSL